MPYLSHPVRRIREDPIAGETVGLLVSADEDADLDALADRLAEVGTVEERLRFRTVKVTVDHGAVDAVCELSGVATVETVNTLAIDADGAGEDVDPVS